MTDGPDTTSPEQARIAAFEATIGEQEGLLYGIALFFEGLCVMFEGQEAVIETYRKQFRNVIQTGQAAIARARELLDEAKADAHKVPLLEAYAFSPGQGHPDPEGLIARARILVNAYEKEFPGRPRDQALSREENLRLMDAAALSPLEP